MKIPFTTAVLGCVLAGACLLELNNAEAAAKAAPSTIQRVDNGITPLSLGGQNLIGVRSRRENFNAHSFEVVSFYFRDTSDAKPELNLVPIFGTEKGKHEERYEITVSGGADCLLHDFRLVKGQGKQPARLVVAHRTMGDSYVTPGAVQFVYYDLMQNEEGIPGNPPLYFEEKSRTNSRQKYCDVNEAFDQELKMGTSSGQ